MNVSAAALSRWDAMPRRRWVEETNSRGMPIGVESGAGWTYRFVEVSTGIRLRCGRGEREFAGEDGDGEVWAVHAETSESVAMAMAVVMRCAITHPTIFSREDVDAPGDEDNRKR